MIRRIVFCSSICSCIPHLVSLEYFQGSWRELASAFANDKTLILLNSTNQVRTQAVHSFVIYLYIASMFTICNYNALILLQRSLAQTLVLSAYGMRNSESSNQ